MTLSAWWLAALGAGALGAAVAAGGGLRLRRETARVRSLTEASQRRTGLPAAPAPAGPDADNR